MGFGENAPVMASHILLVIIGVGTIWRLMRLEAIPRTALGVPPRWLFPSASSMVLVVFIVERLYYIAARAAPGIDLWNLQPAPAVLSLIVAFGIYWLNPPVMVASGLERPAIQRRCAVEIAGLAALWLMITAVLL